MIPSRGTSSFDKASCTEIAYLPNPDGETPTMGEGSNHKVDGSGDMLLGQLGWMEERERYMFTG